MYTQFFHLKQPPFSIAPDPRYLFMSERHREALAHLLYGVGGGGGFVLLTGEIGAGKTTVCRCLIEQLPANCALAYIFNPKLSVDQLLLSVCGEFGIPAAGGHGLKGYVDAINAYLLASHAQGKNNVLIIDEAQNLSAEVLEQLRLLTNLETNERKLLQIILIGQPELRAMLARPELEQLAQRVIARYHLGALSANETGNYIAHRLAVAGAGAAPLFSSRLTGAIHRISRGVPRRINLLCDRALLGAYAENTPHVSGSILRKAAREVFCDDLADRTARRARAALGAAVLAGAAISGVAVWHVMGQANIVPQLVPSAVPVGAAGRAGPSPSVAPTVVAAPVVAAPVVATTEVAVPVAPLPVLATAEQALRELALLWGTPLGKGEPCQAGQRLALRCHQGRGGLYELRQLDRPAMLALHDGSGALSYVLLTGLTDTSATLRAGGREQQISVAQLTARFDGEFTTFWRVPRPLREGIVGGQRGPDVDWLAAHLARARGVPVPRPNAPLDDALLRQFQRDAHLKPDGMAGARTFMRLSRLDGVAEPRLLAVTEK